MIAQFTNWLQTLRHIHDLSGLDDRLLQDMGLERDYIARRVRGDAMIDRPVLFGYVRPSFRSGAEGSGQTGVSGCDCA